MFSSMYLGALLLFESFTAPQIEDGDGEKQSSRYREHDISHETFPSLALDR
jgi:hypothetical protein